MHYDITVDGLSLRSVQERDLPALRCRSCDLQTFDYISNSNPAVRLQGGRGATTAGVAYLMLETSQFMNAHGPRVWLKFWLRNNAAAIREKLIENDHDVFIVLVNYTTAQTQHSTIYSGHSAFLTDTVHDLGAIGEVLTHERMYGPAHMPVAHNRRHTIHSTYLIGTRAGAGSSLMPDPLRKLREKPDTSFLSRYGL